MMKQTDRMPRPKFGIKHALAVTAMFAYVMCLVLIYRHVSSTRAIVSIDYTDGRRIRVVQNMRGEPFDTKVFFDSGDGRWGFYYYDHEDWYWNEAEVESAGETVRISRRGRCTVELNTSTGACIVDPPNSKRREYETPVDYRTRIWGLRDS